MRLFCPEKLNQKCPKSSATSNSIYPTNPISLSTFWIRLPVIEYNYLVDVSDGIVLFFTGLMARGRKNALR